MKDRFTKDWLQAAWIDLDSVDKLLPFEHLTSVVSFLCQQSIEKSFKAVFEYFKLDIIKTHNLLRLYSAVCSQVTLNNIDEKRLNKLNDLYTDSRYPSEFGLLPDEKPSLEEAKEFYKFALNIYEQIKILLEQNNKGLCSMLIKVIAVKPLDDYQLEITFDTGETKTFDCKYLLNQGVFKQLKENSLFKFARVEYGTVTWPNEIDIAPDTLYLNSKLIDLTND